VTERDDGGHDRRIAAVARQIADEGSIDLERVDAEVLQVRERAIARAEVVE
jgi:hypothetical protein